MQRAFTEKETRVFSHRAGASQFDDFIMTAVRNLAQNQNYYETKFFFYIHFNFSQSCPSPGNDLRDVIEVDENRQWEGQGQTYGRNR